jgi:hypothetical protein
MCDDKTIKELLPAYREQGLDQADALRVRNHLDSCEDCRSELSVLRMLAEDAALDPGEAFWAAMPGRVYRAVQDQQTRKKSFGLVRLLDRITLPRWGWAAATLGALLILSWYINLAVQEVPEMAQSYDYEFTDETETTGSLSVNALDHDELITIETWAGGELASIASEAEQVVWNTSEIDIDEELGDLNAQDVEQLSKMLEHIRREG